MKAIMISIKPKYVVDILNGRKTIEIRKTCPKCELPIDVYIYCSKGNKKNWHLIEVVDTDTGCESYEYDYYIGSKGYLDWCLDGKVVAKFTLNEVEEIAYECGNNGISDNGYKWFYTEKLDLVQDFEKACCLNSEELYYYLKPREAKGKTCGYAWHIDNLVIFDKPKELSYFNSYTCKNYKTKKCEQCRNSGITKICYKKLTRPFQSWGYVEE